MATVTSTDGTVKRDEKKILRAGQSLGIDEALRSTNGRFRLVMQRDNDLVLYDNADEQRPAAMWSTNTRGKSGSPMATLGTDGNFVVFIDRDEVWSSKTAKKGDATSTLELEDDGNLLIWHLKAGIWQTGTALKPGRIPPNILKAGERFRSDDKLVSTNGKYKLVVNDKWGLLIVTNDTRKRIWSTSTIPNMGARTSVLERNGNLVLYRNARVEWSSETDLMPDPLLTLQDDGILVLTSGGIRVWASDDKQNERPVVNSETVAVEKKPLVNINTLRVGEALGRNERITSLNKKYYVLFDEDKIRVHKQDGAELWSAGKETGPPSERIKVRGDGEIEMSYTEGYVVWKLGNAEKGNGDCFYIIQDDGDFVLMTNGKQAWHSDTRRLEDGNEPIVDRLRVGESLPKGKKLISPNRKFELRMQSDGNLVLYDGSKATWSTNTKGRGWGCDILDNDSFIVAGSDWSSGTRRRPSGGKGELILQDDGKLIFKTDGYIIWSTDSSLVQPYPQEHSQISNGANQLRPGDWLTTNQYLTSPNNQFTATLQPDGDFIVRQKSMKIHSWRSQTAPNSTVKRIQVQYDGNCVMVGANESAVWATDSHTSGGDGTLRLNDDGSLTINGWSSNYVYFNPGGPRNISAYRSNVVGDNFMRI